MRVLYINHELAVRSSFSYSTHNPLLQKDASLGDGMTFVKALDLNSVDVDNYDIIIIDESQFFGNLPSSVIKFVEEKGKNVIVGGLNGDYKRQVFGDILSLIPLADEIVKLNSFCIPCSLQSKCITLAPFTRRINSSSSEQILVGGAETYQPDGSVMFQDVNTDVTTVMYPKFIPAGILADASPGAGAG